jgi:hypothetical protein
MPVTISWYLEIDSKHDGTFGGFYDNISSYVMSINSNAGFTSGQDAYHAISEPVAPPAQMQITLDNSDTFFSPEKTYSDVAVNGSFTAWAAGNPTSWTVTGEVGTNPEISQVAPEQAHGGSGSGACNIYSTSATVSISQNVVGVHSSYRLTMNISKVTTGVVAVYCGAEKIGVFGEEGIFTESFIAGSTTITIQNQTANCDVTINSISIIQTQAFTDFLRPGTLLRFRARYNSLVQIFIGKITEGGVVYGVNDKSGDIAGQTVTVTIQDATLDLTDIEYAPPLLTNVTTGAVLQRFFDDSVIAWPYLSKNWIFGVSGASELDYTTYLASNVATSLATGQTTFAFSGTVADNGKGIQALQFIRDVVMAEAGGRFYFNPRNGTWIFHDRSRDALLSTVSATINVNICDDAKYIFADDLVNSISVNYTVREVGLPGTVLYTSKTSPVRVDANTVRKVTGRYLAADTSTKRIGGTDFLPINSPKTYSVAADTGNSTLPIGKYTVSAIGKASSVEITLDNQTKAPIYVFGLTFRGTPLIWYDETVNYSDPQSMRKFDSRTKQPLNLKMIDDTNLAYAICQYIVSRYSKTAARFDSITFEATTSATLAGHMQNRSIGDRITLTSTLMNHNTDYIIIGESHSVDAAARTHKVTWYLKSLGHEILWILDKVGKAELGINTYLGL